MASPRLFTYKFAESHLGNNFSGLQSTIAYDHEHNYFYFLLELSIPKSFIEFTSLDSVAEYQKVIFEQMYGDLREIPDELSFNLECKCFSDLKGIELVVFKPWCQTINLSAQLLNTIEKAFFVCIDIRMFLILVRNALFKGQIQSESFKDTKVLNQIVLDVLYTFSLNNANNLGRLNYYLDEDIRLEHNSHLSMLEIILFLQELNQKKFLKSGVSHDFILKNNEWNAPIERCRFVFELFRDDETQGYIVLSYKEFFDSPLIFSQGFFLDYYVKVNTPTEFVIRAMINLSEFLDKYSTSIKLYVDNRGRTYPSDIFKAMPFNRSFPDVYEMFIAKRYYEDVELEFLNSSAQELKLYGDPNEPPFLHL